MFKMRYRYPILELFLFYVQLNSILKYIEARNKK